jgi:NDP-sugar pyrophosphorylase family protein
MKRRTDLEGRLVILAGGVSSRMKKNSVDLNRVDKGLIKDADNKSKFMIGVGKNSRPFLDYLLYNARQSGYNDIVIVIGERDTSIKEYYGNKESGNNFKGLTISYAVQPIPEGMEKPLGTADALYRGIISKPEWSGGKFTVCNSDNLYSQRALKMMLNSKYKNAMVDYDIEEFCLSKEQIRNYAVTKKNGEGFITAIIEKPSLEIIDEIKKSDGYIGVSMNIFRLDYDMVLPALVNVPIHPTRNEKELPTAVVMVADLYKNSVYAYPLKEHVPDLTSKKDILPVKEYLEKEFVDFDF